MGIIELVRAVGRRWYVLVAGLLLTAGLAVAVFRLVPVTFDAKASLLLLPPQKTVTETTGNPFLNLGGLDVVSGVLALSLTDTQTVSSVVPPKSKTTYLVVQDGSVSGSVLDVTASATTPQEALSTLATVESLAGDRLKSLQDAVSAPEDTQARIITITNNTKAVANPGSLIRALIAVVAVGVILTFLAAIAVDSIARRRKARKEARRLAVAAEAEALAQSQDSVIAESSPKPGDSRRGGKRGKRAKETFPDADVRGRESDPAADQERNLVSRTAVEASDPTSPELADELTRSHS